MIARHEYPAGVPCWIDIARTDVEGAAAFYGGLFGWEFEERLPPDSGAHYLIARLDGLVVGAIGTPDGVAPPMADWFTYVAVDDVDASVASVRAAGGSTFGDVIEIPHAGRTAICADPAGAVICLWEPKARRGAELVNAPGSWNFSTLTTPDPDRAEAFYGAVFGWVARTIDLGTEKATMWCRPGYGEFLASIDPEIRERQAGDGVPDGFADAVGWLSVASDATPATWSTTFAVDGTDAAVERAVALGARVVAPPVDAGPTRVAVLEDPHGGVFTVSTYQPG